MTVLTAPFAAPGAPARLRRIRAARGGILLIFILSMMTAIAPLSIDMYLPALLAIGNDLGAPASQVQLTLSLFFIGFALGQIAYGPLSDRYGRRPIILGGLALYIGTSAWCAVAGSIEELQAARLLHALGGGAGVVVARAVVRDLFETDRAARVFSLMLLVMAAAPLIAPLAGGYVLLFLGWRAIFWILTAFGAAVMIAAWRYLPESNPKSKRGERRLSELFTGYIHAVREPAALGYTLTGAFTFGALFAYLAASPFVYMQFFGVAEQHYGYLFGVNVLGLMALSWLNSRLVMRLGARRMLLGGVALIAAAGLLLAVLAGFGIGGLLGVVLPLFFVIAPLSLVGANALALATQNHPTRAGTVSALFGAAQFGLGGFATLLVGALHDGTALPMGVVMAGFAVLGLMAALVTGRWISRGRDTAPASPESPA